jgi:hypothetical protein
MSAFHCLACEDTGLMPDGADECPNGPWTRTLYTACPHCATGQRLRETDDPNRCPRCGQVGTMPDGDERDCRSAACLSDRADPPDASDWREAAADWHEDREAGAR